MSQLLTIFQLLVEHVQAASYARTLQPGGWNKDSDNFFEGLEYIRLRIPGKTWLALLIIFCVLTGILFLINVLFSSKLAKLFQDHLIVRFIFQNICYGVLAFPILGIISETAFCDINNELDIYNNIECFKQGHHAVFITTLFVLGLYFFSLLLFMVAIVGKIEDKNLMLGEILWYCYYFNLAYPLSNGRDATLLFVLSIIFLAYLVFCLTQLKHVKITQDRNQAHSILTLRIISLSGLCWIWICGMIKNAHDASYALIGWPIVMSIFTLVFGLFYFKMSRKWDAQDKT